VSVVTAPTQVVLGIDPSTTRIGLALVEFEPPHRALWAETVSINEPDGGWLDQQIRRALGCAEVAGGFGDDVTRWAFDRDLTRIGIERAINHRNAGNSYDAGGVYHLVLAECHRRWPWAVQVPRLPAQWKKDTAGRGNASKAEVMEWAMSYDAPGQVLHLLPQDSADALAIAVSAAMVELVDAA